MNPDLQAQVEAAIARIARELDHIGGLAERIEAGGSRAGLELRLRLRPDGSKAWTVLPLGDVGVPAPMQWVELPPSDAGDGHAGMAH
jgi:hypothetical protein